MPFNLPDSPVFPTHPFDFGGSTGIPDRPCVTCGRPDRDPIHSKQTSAIEELIKQSVFRFEAKLSQFGVLTMAKAAGWVSDYRKELEGIAAAAKSQ